VRGLRIGFAGRTVLAGVNCELRSGELLGLVGRNGSGKTTLLRAVTRIVGPESGEIRVMGAAIQDLSSSTLARRIAVLPQATELPPGFTVDEIVLMGRTPYLSLLGRERPNDFRAARQAMQQTETWSLRTRRVETLSGGERQRVLLARALAQETPILLLDEPTAHLDLAHQAEALRAIATLRAERGISALVVVHDLTLAAHYCDRLLLLHGGRIAAEGQPADVLTPERLTQVYGPGLVVIRHPMTGRPVVLPAG
jgi:iron complex transport system ATP-binding protein